MDLLVSFSMDSMISRVTPSTFSPLLGDISVQPLLFPAERL